MRLDTVYLEAAPVAAGKRKDSSWIDALTWPHSRSRFLRGVHLGLLASIAALTALISIGAWSGSASAASTHVINFEDFGAGSTALSSLSTDGGGISGPTLSGSVSLISSGAATGPHMIFDANCVGAGCSGGDSDLSAPSLGKVLIYSEDGDAGDPDDCFCSPQFTFSFSGLGSGGISPESVTALDVESGGSVTLQGSGAGLPAVIPIPAVGDGAIAVVSLSAALAT